MSGNALVHSTMKTSHISSSQGGQQPGSETYVKSCTEFLTTPPFYSQVGINVCTVDTFNQLQLARNILSFHRNPVSRMRVLRTIERTVASGNTLYRSGGLISNMIGPRPSRRYDPILLDVATFRLIDVYDVVKCCFLRQKLTDRRTVPWTLLFVPD